MTINSWTDVQPGDVITVKVSRSARPHKIAVTRVEPPLAMENADRALWVWGERLRMSGKPSTAKDGGPAWFLSLPEVIAVECPRSSR